MVKICPSWDVMPVHRVIHQPIPLLFLMGELYSYRYMGIKAISRVNIAGSVFSHAVGFYVPENM